MKKILGFTTFAFIVIMGSIFAWEHLYVPTFDTLEALQNFHAKDSSWQLTRIVGDTELRYLHCETFTPIGFSDVIFELNANLPDTEIVLNQRHSQQKAIRLTAQNGKSFAYIFEKPLDYSIHFLPIVSGFQKIANMQKVYDPRPAMAKHPFYKDSSIEFMIPSNDFSIYFLTQTLDQSFYQFIPGRHGSGDFMLKRNGEIELFRVEIPHQVKNQIPLPMNSKTKFTDLDVKIEIQKMDEEGNKIGMPILDELSVRAYIDNK